MHKNIKLKKQHHCLICFNSLMHDSGFETFVSRCDYICNKCAQNFKIIDYKQNYKNISIWFLYQYNEFARKLVYQYKGCYDIELCKVFLDLYLSKLKKKYKDHYIIYPPSNKKDNLVRGFNHIQEIAKQINNNVFDIFYKKEEMKQSNASLQNKKLIKNIIKIKDCDFLNNKKILLLDDIYTTGNTIKTCINLIFEKVRQIQDFSVVCIFKTQAKSVEL